MGSDVVRRDDPVYRKLVWLELLGAPEAETFAILTHGTMASSSAVLLQSKPIFLNSRPAKIELSSDHFFS
jgi:hypothetical protein